MTIIHILNHQTGELIGHLDSESDKFFWDAKHVHGLDGEHSQQFTMPADLEEAALLEGRTRFLIPLEDGGFEEFIHFESDTQMEDEKTVYGTPYYKDMDKKYILPPGKYTGTAKELANLVLPFVKFEVGVVENNNKRTITIDQHIGAYSFLEKISSTFNLEIQFRMTTAGSRITGRFADFFKRIGADTYKEIELGKDLLAINMKEHAERIVTGLFCIGPEREDGTRLTTTVLDDEAFQRWNEDGEHIIEIYEPESSEQDMTLTQLQQYGRTELNKRIASIYEYTVTAASLEELFPHEKVRLGDSVRLKNPEFSPPLYADARVIRIERSLTDPDAKTYDIGEIVTYDEDEILQSFRKLQQQHNMRVIRSVEKPPGSSNKIWVQIVPAADGKPAMEVPHVWSTQLNDWVKVAPTSPAEIGAEPEIPSQPTPPDPAIYPKWVDTSGEIAILKMWNPTTLKYDAVEGPPGPPGYTPVKGTDYFDGAPGQDGTDGTSSYLWIRYSQNADGSGMVDYPTDAKYIGVSTTQIGIAPTAPSAYRWTLIKGTDGVPGEPGTDGRTSYLHIKYSNDGGATFTGNSGEDAGDWIGTYVDFTAADSTNPATYTWNKVKGEKGDQGFPGEPGADGKTSYTHIAYATNSTGTTGFSTTDSVAKTYIGMYVDFTALDSSDPAKYKWTLIKGAKGDQGTPGDPGENGLTPYFHVAYASNATGTLNFHASDPTGRAYMGTYTDFVSADSTDPAKYTWQLVKGEKGDQGSPGDPGDNGLTPYFHTAYASSSNGATNFHVSDPTGRDYIGTYSDFTSADSSDPTKYTWMLVKGAKGDTGNPGKGIISAVVTYQLDTDGTSAPTGTWSSTIPAPIKGRYLWTRTVSTYTDNSTVTTYSVSYLATDGQTGKGISSTAVAYQIGASGTAAPTGAWSTTVPAPSPGNYLWTRTLITYSDNTTSLAYSTSYFAKDGQKGDSGKGVTSIIEQYYLSTSATTQTGGTWSTTVPTWVDGRFMWTRSVITYTDGTSTTTPAVNVTGSKGTTGSTGTGVSKVDVMYYLSTSATSLTGGTWSTTAPTWVDGRYMWSKTVVTYTNGTTSETAAANITGAKGSTGNTGPAGELNLLTDPNKTGDLGGWSGNSGGVYSLEDIPFVDGRTIKALKSVSSGNHFLSHTSKDIDSSKMYEVSIWLKSDSQNGSDYFGLYAYDGAGANIGVYSVGNNNGIKSSALNTNPYFWSGDLTLNTWTKFTAYILPAGIDLSDADLAKGLGIGVDTNFVFPSDAKKVAIRYLNYYNSTQQILYAALPVMKEVDISVLQANKAKNASEISQATADGKNTVIYAPAKPSLTGRKVNDIWFDTDDGNKMHRFNGSDFVAEQFGSSAFSNIDAGKITSGIIDSITFRSGFGTAKRFELSDGTATFTEDLASGMQSITTLNDNGLKVNFKDGVDNFLSDLSPMGLMFRSNYAGDTLYGPDYIQMNSATLSELWLLTTDNYGQLQASHKPLRLTGQTNTLEISDAGIDFVNGAYFFPNNGEAVTRYQEKGFMAAGSMGGGTTGFTTFGGVNFRTKKTYTPSSISYTTVSSNRTPSFYDINADGFMFALNGSGSVNALVYFRGHYTA